MKTALVALALLLSVCAPSDSVVVELVSGRDDGSSYPKEDVVVSLVPLEETGPGEWRVDGTAAPIVVRSDGFGRAEFAWDPTRPYRIRAVYRVSDDAACFWMGGEHVHDASTAVTVALQEVCE